MTLAIKATRPLLCCLALLLLSCGSERVPESRVPAPAEFLMPGTLYETPVYVLDSRRQGSNVLVLAGVHGDEPGAWLAAEELVKRGQPRNGRVIVVPRANVVATEQEVRSTPELGDLNRLYGATSFELPMASMASEIVGLARRYGVSAVIDLHESWQPYDDESNEDDSVDTGHIGQTVSGAATESSRALARSIVGRANSALPEDADFTYFEFPADYEEQEIVPVPADLPPGAVPNKSSSFISEALPRVDSVLVEVSQQQTMARRIHQQLIVVSALAAEL